MRPVKGVGAVKRLRWGVTGVGGIGRAAAGSDGHTQESMRKTTAGQSARAGRKQGGILWQRPLTQVVKGALYRIGGRSELPASWRHMTPRCADVQEKKLDVDGHRV